MARLTFPIVVLTFFLCFGPLPATEGANILFLFVGGSYSHKVGMWPLLSALADNKHNVTFLSPYTKKPVEDPRIHDVVVPTSVAKFLGMTYTVDRLALRREGRALEFWKQASSATLRVCHLLFANEDKDPIINHLLYEAEYDLIVNNAVFAECGYILNARCKSKLILSLPSFFMPWHADLFGMPVESSWVPEVTGKFSFPMGFLDRLYNLYLPLKWFAIREWYFYPILDEMTKNIFKFNYMPSMKEIEKNHSLIFVNNHFGTTELARSLPPSVIDIGGMQAWQASKPLAKEFQDYLDDAKDGAILIAFGSTINLKNIPEYFKTTFFTMISKFPHIKFILRWDGDLPESVPKNIKVSKWLPQFEILGHKNVKAFISHAGLNSLTEATFQGVPVILLPIFADQDYNGYNIEANGMGLRLEIETLTSKVMEDAVREILTNDRYAISMTRLSKIFRDRPVDPIKKALFYTEFVLRHDDTSSLKPLKYLNVFQQRNFDVLLVIWFVAVVIISISLLLLIKCSKAIITSNKTNQVKNDSSNNKSQKSKKNK